MTTYNEAFNDGYEQALEEMGLVVDDREDASYDYDSDYAEEGYIDDDYYDLYEDDHYDIDAYDDSAYENYILNEAYDQGYYDAMEALGSGEGFFQRIKNVALNLLEKVKTFLTVTVPKFFSKVFGGNKPQGLKDKLKNSSSINKLNKDSNKLANTAKTLAGVLGVGFTIGAGALGYKQYTKVKKERDYNRGEAERYKNAATSQRSRADLNERYLSSAIAQGRQAAKERDYNRGEAERYKNAATSQGKARAAAERRIKELEAERDRETERANTNERYLSSAIAQGRQAAKERDYHKSEAERYKGAATAKGRESADNLAKANQTAELVKLVSAELRETKNDLRDAYDNFIVVQNEYERQLDNNKVLSKAVDKQADKIMQLEAGRSKLHGSSKRSFQHEMYEEAKRQQGLNY